MSNYFFEGARADLSKVVSPNPAFQITHSFTLGAQKSSYMLGALFADQNTFLHGQWDPSTGGVNMRANQTWSSSDVTKVQGQVSAERRVQWRAAGRDADPEQQREEAEESGCRKQAAENWLQGGETRKKAERRPRKEGAEMTPAR